MVMVDALAGQQGLSASDSERRKPLLGLTGIGLGLIVAVLSFALHGGGLNGLRFAAEMVLRTSSLILVLAYVARPLGRLLPAAEPMAREQPGFQLGFAGMYGTFLACVVLPGLFTVEHLPFQTLFFLTFSAFILAVMLFSGSDTVAERIGAPTARIIQSLSVGYFMLAFTASYAMKLIAPHRPDAFFGIALILFVAAFALRSVDVVVQRRRYRDEDKAI